MLTLQQIRTMFREEVRGGTAHTITAPPLPRSPFFEDVVEAIIKHSSHFRFYHKQMLNKAKKVKVDFMLRYFCPKFSLRFFTRSRKKPGSASWFVISTFHAGLTETWVRRKKIFTYWRIYLQALSNQYRRLPQTWDDVSHLTFIFSKLLWPCKIYFYETNCIQKFHFSPFYADFFRFLIWMQVF